MTIIIIIATIYCFSAWPVGALKEHFVKISKNLARYRPIDLKIISLDRNNSVERSSWLLEYSKYFTAGSSCLSILQNYFNDRIKLFSDLYL